MMRWGRAFVGHMKQAGPPEGARQAAGGLRRFHVTGAFAITWDRVTIIE